MSTERVIIHLPTTPAAPDEIYNLVISASQAENHFSQQALQLYQYLTKVLAPHNIAVELTGSNCLAISDFDDHIAQLLLSVSPVLSYFTTLTVLENEQLVWTFGDENSNFTTETMEYQAPWASLRSIPYWIDYITTNAWSLANLNVGTDPRDFLIISDNTKIEHYIQCYFSPDSNNYRVEMRLGDALHHYWCDKNDAASVIQELSTWMSAPNHSTAGWNKLDIS